MASLVADNPYDTTQQKFSGTGDVVGQITGGARNGDTWDFMDQRGNRLTSVPYQDFVNNYQSDGAGAVRSGVNSVNGIPVYNFSGQPTAPQSAGAQPNGLVGGAMTGTLQQQSPPTNVSLPINVGTSPTVTPNVATYAPTTRTVNQATETTQGQINSILAQDSPLMQRARTLAAQGMNQRGLVNSSMAQGAGTAAMIDRATPIAAQDAQTFSQAAEANMNALNQAGQFNAGEINKFGIQKAQQDFQSAQAELDRAQQTALADKSIAAQKDLQVAQQNFQGAQAALDRANQQSMQGAQIAAQRDLAAMDMKFRTTQAQLDRDNQKSMIQFQNDLNNANVSKAFATQIAGNTLNAINAIQADPNLDASKKTAAIQNVIDTGNSTMQWGSTFYNTPLPTIAAPNSTAKMLNPGGSYGTGSAGSSASAKPAWQVYLDANPDVTRVLGYSEGAAKSHYQQYGAAEGRQGAEELRKTL